MTLEPLLTAPLPIQIHAFAAIGALAIGIVQLAGVKGTNTHRILGWTWVALMATVAASSFQIHELRVWGPWSPIHLLAIAVLIQLPLAVLAARRSRVSAHKRIMVGLFVGGLIVAGLFTLLPSRIMGHVLFG